LLVDSFEITLILMPLFARDEGTEASMNAAAQYETEKILAELPDRISDVIKPFARESPDHPATTVANSP
jgi:hypothetical protein